MVLSVDTPPPLNRALTDEELRNLTLYGQCRECEMPRFPKKVARVDDKITRTHMTLTCPNGHVQ